MHALIIEDEVLAVEVIEAALRVSGYNSFDVAFSASEAIAAAEIRCPDLITADQKLIDGTGVDAVLEICAEQAIPVLFITANPDLIGRLLPRSVVVAKPFMIDEVRSAVGQAVARPFLASEQRAGN